MKHTYIVEAEFEADLAVHFNALSRYCADSDFEARLRSMWKHREMSEEAFSIVEELWEAWHSTRADIGEVQ
jgi:hypothetical protein